ncbi:antichymotrypsin-2-like isoform X4 [Trichoplusia ni]|uniref:Antichymotrypsin-2-like isoform X4 n=1 Tax=Trichoplusia ni TaxID=7111 RepID=A0A7E5VCK6_TRINI|nr:antichymotrypsin-2-like isoform X4 [Trichoplusia ni]
MKCKIDEQRILVIDRFMPSMWILCTILLLFATSETNSNITNMDSKAFSSAIAHFSSKFCVELEKGKSVVSSPLSAEYLLALLALGTTDRAHEELLTSLGFPDDDSIRSSFLEASTKLKSISGVTFNVANKVYLPEGAYDLQEEIKNDAIKVFDAGIEKLDFSNGAAAADTINKWVEGKTNNRIKDLLSADSLDISTRIVLVNALYFKGTWKKQFDPIHTRNLPFHITSNSTVDVPMMYKEDDYRYGDSEELKAQLLEIPYVGDEASMLIVLPHDIEGLEDVLAKLAGGYDLMAEYDNMYSTKVQVTLPKFKIETEIDLGVVLRKLGIQAIFNRGGSGITKMLNTNEELYVSKAVQKAFIEVNEEGAEAAAATAIRVRNFTTSLRVPRLPRIFKADRPYLVTILVKQIPHFIALFRAPKV